MVITYSSNKKTKTTIKNFLLLEVNTWKKQYINTFLSNKANVIMFICNHCPYVKHINIELVRLSNEFMKKEISFIAINSNNSEKYPEDSPKNMKKISIKYNYQFPYFFDDKQEAAKYYGAKCTPEFFIFLRKDKLYYHGQFDDSRPSNKIPVTGMSIRNALQNIIDNNLIKNYPIVNSSCGCNIKWNS
ncbi:thioredoxin family protein [Blattabacterium cuenoti]|uniref:thioredoxin family protein n=1 Tax=Blattabacterium cuenoti TaxID=1653831 RepID=UPI00163C6CF1|nr:thioredoxin family protein [Blattabacterium cuenoti]